MAGSRLQSLVLLLFLLINLANPLTVPTRIQFNPTFFTANSKLLTTPTSPCSTGTGLRWQTFVQPLGVTGLDTSNRMQVAVGVTDLFFDFTASNFTWDVSVPSFNSTSINFYLYVSGSNVVTYLGVSYLVSSNLLFNIGYSQSTFGSSSNVTTPNNATNTFACAADYSVDPINPTPKTCRKASVTVPYSSAVILNTTANLAVRVFLSGITAFRPGTDNIGFTASNESPGSTSFSYSAVAYGNFTFNSENTLLYMMNLYYVAYERKTITNDFYSLLWEGVSNANNGCWYRNSTNCSAGPHWLGLNGAGPVYTPNVMFYGFKSLYTTADAGQNGNFQMTSSGPSGNNLVTYWLFTGNPSHNYQLSASYVVYQRITCAGIALDIYLTIDRANCNVTCNAGVGQYPDANNTCQNCSTNCYSCQTSSNQCTACVAGSNRVLNGSTCVCNPQGYYWEASNLTCIACSYTCLSCTFWTNASCTSCDLAVQHRLLQTDACPCTTGYYDSGLPICTACDVTCLTCSGAGSTACLSCDASTKRYLSGSSCLCPSLYYDNATAVCASCHYSCVTCVNNTVTGCVTCNATAYRFYSTNNCVCSQGYYDVGPPVMLCAACDPTCFVCNGPLNTNCIMLCDATKFRNMVINQCLCIAHYYQVAGSCYPCDITCGNCTEGTDQMCSTCSTGSFRSLVVTSCVCDAGYYQARQTNCLACSYTCVTCNVTFSQCTSCNATNFRSALAGNTCPCDPGYYDTGVGLCATCHYSCTTCTSAGATGCSSCDTAIRYLSSGQCLCKVGTYDTGVNATCQPCDYTCLTCSAGTALSCVSCNSSYQRILTSGSCPCSTGYYDTGLNQAQCQICSISCNTCSQQPTNCTSCNPANARTLVGSTCVCIAHYYENGLAACPICVNYCLNCTMYSVCTACDASNFRYLTLGSCYCLPGYFDTGSVVCAICSYSCLTCNFISTYCLTCNTSAMRSPGPSATCPCQAGYYDNGVTLCAMCQYSCDTCNGGLATNCLSCNTTAQRQLGGGQCLCKSGYYDNGAMEQCLSCNSTCLTCTLSSTSCSTCDPAVFRVLLVHQCVCQSGYYENSLNQCVACDSSCLSCSGALANQCTACQPTQFRTLNGTFCSCSLGYFDSGSPTCPLCSYTCLTCYGSGSNCTSCQPTDNRVLTNNICSCMDGYFDNGAAACTSCSSQCMTCELSSTNCLSCNVTQLTVLSGNICVCVVGAYIDPLTSLCKACHYSCESCSNASSSGCLTCPTAKYRKLVGNSCVCINGYVDRGTAVCAACDISCQTCSGGSTRYNCTSCFTGFTLFTSVCLPNLNCSNYYMEGKCINNCPNYTYPLSNVCRRCTNNCMTCLNATACTSCQYGTYYSPVAMTCSSSCGALQFINGSQCSQCPSSCASCAIDNAGVVICTSCSALQFFYKGTCVGACPVNLTIAQSRVCVDCVYPCATCTALTSEDCLSCVKGSYMLGTSCLTLCPAGMFGSSLTSQCETCPSNCTQCKENSLLTGQAFCTQCVFPLYSSFGTCVNIGSFNNNGSIMACHPNCLTCTNSSFSSCIRCKVLRGNNNQMAIRGYCDCQEGSVDRGQGICDKVAYQAIQSANTFLVTTTAFAGALSVIVSAATANPMLFVSLARYCQQIGQVSYLNLSVPASVDQLYHSYTKFNLGRVFEGSFSKPTARRLLYDNSTQSVQSLFLHNRTQEDISVFCYIMIGLSLLMWLTLGCSIQLAELFKAKFQKTASSSSKKLYKIFTAAVQFLKFNAFVYLLLITFLEVCFNMLVSIKIACSEPERIDIKGLALSCGLFLYQLAVGTYFSVKIFKQQNASKASSLSAMVANFSPKSTKWYQKLFFSVTLIKALLLQLWIVALSHNPIAQAVAWAITQLSYVCYVLLAHPFESPYSRLVIVNELLTNAQLVLFCVLALVPEDSRFNYSLALIAVGYVQICVFVVYSVSQLFKGGSVCRKDWSRSNKTANAGDTDEKYAEQSAERKQSKPNVLEQSQSGADGDLHEQVKPNLYWFEAELEAELKQDLKLGAVEDYVRQIENTHEDLLEEPPQAGQGSEIPQLCTTYSVPQSAMKVRRRYRNRQIFEDTDA